MYILVPGLWNEHLRMLNLNDRCAAFNRQSHKYKTWVIAINLSSYPVLRSGCCLYHLLELGKRTLICTSACCTPGGIRKSPLLTFSTALYYRCVLRQRVVPPVGSENPPYWRSVPHYNVVVSYVSVLYTRWDPKTPLTDVWYRILLSLFPMSACCTSGVIPKFPFLTFHTALYIFS